jgi:hypothetical protein
MPNLILAPEDDDSDFPRVHNLASSPLVDETDMNQGTELQRLRFHFNPHKVGFGILPWPGVDPAGKNKDKVVIAMKYLMEGKDHTHGEDNQ